MTVLTWAIRLIVFSLLVVFAVHNTDPVILRLFMEQTWQAPLVIVLLAFFVGGALFGVLSMLGLVYRQRRQIAGLKRAVANAAAPAASATPPLA